MRYYKILRETRIYDSKGHYTKVEESLELEKIDEKDIDSVHGDSFFDWVERCGKDDYIYFGHYSYGKMGIESELDLDIKGEDGYTKTEEFFKYIEITKAEYDRLRELEALYESQTRTYEEAFGF